MFERLKKRFTSETSRIQEQVSFCMPLLQSSLRKCLHSDDDNRTNFLRHLRAALFDKGHRTFDAQVTLLNQAQAEDINLKPLVDAFRLRMDPSSNIEFLTENFLRSAARRDQEFALEQITLEKLYLPRKAE